MLSVRIVLLIAIGAAVAALAILWHIHLAPETWDSKRGLGEVLVFYSALIVAAACLLTGLLMAVLRRGRARRDG